MKNNLLSKHAKSFNWAGFFLPKKIYKKSSVLYDFCRTLDDIADQDLNIDIKTMLRILLRLDSHYVLDYNSSIKRKYKNPVRESS